MYKNGRKILALLFVIAFLTDSFAGNVFASQQSRHSEQAASPIPTAIPEDADSFREESAAEEEIQRKLQQKDNLYEEAKQAEHVRVIVELKGEPVLSEAIRQGVSYAELPQPKIEELETEIAREQSLALNDLDSYIVTSDSTKQKNNSAEPKVIQYNTGFNGFAVTVKPEDIAEIESKPYVKKVYISEEYERPQMKYSHQMVGSNYAWETKGLKGEGTVVAVIDTGIDVKHQAMTLEDVSKVRYHAQNIAEVIRENDLKGRYYTEKVPYGYNYYDHNENLLDSYGHMHGMHVAGTVAANRKDGAEINGVAPNAQILALKVFSDDIQYPTTFTDVWLKAFDDAIILKADVINMSLGAAAGLASDDMQRPENEAFERAKQAGIVVAVAAGNDRNIVSGNFYGVKALAENPDTALISSPSLIDSSVSVASLENGVKHTTNVYWTTADGQENKARINIKIGVQDAKVVTGEAIHIGYGEDKDYQNKEVQDKIILLELYPQPEKEGDHHSLAMTASVAAIQMHDDHEHNHSMTLEQRIRLAESKNPRAILLYNDKESGEQLGRDLNTLAPLFKKTLAIVGYTGAEKILNELIINPTLELRLSSLLDAEASPEKGKLSAFSSWGPTPDLRIKPEITAPGGNIYSTIEENQYKNMSGTSMASPHIAGAAAILKQFINEQGQDSNLSAAEEIKLRLMNTAMPVRNEDGQVEFVRRQGAGLMQLDKALSTEVFVKATGTNDPIEDGKLELKELENGQFQVKLTVENHSDQEKEFEISMLGMIEVKEDGRLSEKPQNISDFGHVSDTVRISPKAQEEIRFDVDVSQYGEIDRESFVEGYIFLKDISGNGTKVDLSVPFLAYYGDWGLPKAIDAFGIREINETKHRNAQFIINKDNHSRSSMFVTPMGLAIPIIRNTLYFLPDLARTRSIDYYGTFGVRMAPLRNMSRIEYSILDAKTKKTLKVLGENREVRKLSRLRVRPSYVYVPESLWNGDLNGKQVSDDIDLIYQIKATLNNSLTNPDVQIYQFNLKADATAPTYGEDNQTIKLEEHNGNRKKLSFKIKDTGSGLANIYIQSMHFRKREADEDGKHRLAKPDEIGENPDFDVWRPFYGKAVKISFEQPEENANDGQPILRVVDGKLTIPESYLPKNTANNGRIYCNLNGHENKEIEVEVYYDTDTPHIGVFAIDCLDNNNIKYLATGADLRYKLFFVQYDSIVDNQGTITVNDQELNEETISLNEKAEVKIEFPNPNVRIRFLKINNNGENDILISNGQIREEAKEKFGLEVTDSSYRFAVEAITGEVSIQTNIELKGKTLTFGGVDLSKFADNQLLVKTGPYFSQKVNSSATELNVEPDSEVQVVGRILPGHEVKRVFLRHTEFDYPITVDKVDTSDDLFNYPNAYLIQGDKIYIKFEMKGSYELNIVFEGDPDDGGDDDDLFAEKTPKDNTKKKYPVIFLRSPSLLEMKKASEGGSKAITVSGFIGYTDEEIESLSISLIDKKGNLIAAPISYPVDQLVRQEIRYVPAKEVIYHDEGYEFSLELESTTFLTNIRVEAVTKSGRKASIVRRMFFDDQLPSLAYSIDSRKLNEDFMTLQVEATDNSFQVKVYQNGSYLGGEDLSRISLEKDQVRYTQAWKLPLRIGQNRISLKVVDAAGQESVKVLYVYRTEK